jgi:HAD superfamily hydrolase (TIGR01509 family)
MSTLYGLIFDVDGVIADSESVNVRATARAFEDILGIKGVCARDFEAGIGRGAAAYVRAGARAHGKELTADETHRIADARQEQFLAILRHEPLPAFPGVLELITAARNDKRFAVAIATSSTREKSGQVLQSARVPYETMVYICGDDVERKKPHPELFLTACDRLGLMPAQCVVIEDAPNGIRAARAAGCTCIAVTNTCPQDVLAEADLVVDNLTNVTLNTITKLLEAGPGS